MSTPPPATASGAEPLSPQATSLALPPWRWGVSLLVAAAAAWVWLNYTPVQFTLSEELRVVDIYSPPAKQQAAAEKKEELHRQNSLAKLGGVGFCFGAVALLTALGAGVRQQWLPVMLGLVSGVVCGALTAVLGILLRRYFDSDVALPLVDDNNRELVTDMGVYMLTSVLLVLPVSLTVLVGSGKQRGQKAMSIILAGVLTGMLTPIAVYYVLHASKSNKFPLEGLALTAIWLAVLAGLVFVLSTFTGTRPPKAPKAEASSQEGAA